MPPRAKAAVYGPLDITSKIGGDGVPFQTLPFSAVANSQIFIAVDDNAIQAVVAASQTNTSYLLVMTEITVWGSVQGYSSPIKRQGVRGIWGPMSLRLGDDDCYGEIVFSGRLFIGGKPGIPSDMVFATPLKVNATIHVQPREGLGY